MTRFAISGGWLAATVLAVAAGLTAAPAISQPPGTSGRTSDAAMDAPRPTWATPDRPPWRPSSTGTLARAAIGLDRHAPRHAAVSLRAPRWWNGPQVGSYSADVIRIWHGVAAAQPTNPIRQSRVLAMVHAAMHDAVNGAIPVYETYASWLSDGDAHPEAAAAAAAHRVLANLFPTNTAMFDAQLTDSLAGIPDGPAKNAGVALGSAVGDFIVLFRANDGMDIPDLFNPTPGPGVWEPTPPALLPAIEPQMANVTPFTIRSRDHSWSTRRLGSSPTNTPATTTK